MLNRYHSEVYAVLRIFAGLAFAMHGTQKLLGWPASQPAGGGSLPPMILTAGAIELIGGILIALGLFTTVSAFVASGTMAAAYFMAHFPAGWLPIANQGELAAVYAFLFLFVAAFGSGIPSIDAARVRVRQDVRR